MTVKEILETAIGSVGIIFGDDIRQDSDIVVKDGLNVFSEWFLDYKVNAIKGNQFGITITVREPE